MSECYPLTPSDFLFEADDQGSCWRGMAARWTTCGAAAVRALGGGMCWFCGTCWGTFPRHGVLCVDLSLAVWVWDIKCSDFALCDHGWLWDGGSISYSTYQLHCVLPFNVLRKNYSLVESPAFCSKILANCILHMVLHNGNISELHLTHCVLLCYVFLR